MTYIIVVSLNDRVPYLIEVPKHNEFASDPMTLLKYVPAENWQAMSGVILRDFLFKFIINPEESPFCWVAMAAHVFEQVQCATNTVVICTNSGFAHVGTRATDRAGMEAFVKTRLPALLDEHWASRVARGLEQKT
ncbi:MAG: hypothetical protein JWM36_2465 [Hyphomicrobiales bacterium]|nr:hypothetical protein [Hyphomicrobiales bacterium]